VDLSAADPHLVPVAGHVKTTRWWASWCVAFGNAGAPLPWLLVWRLAGLVAAAVVELVRRLRLEPEAKADIFLWVR